jgi:aminopeptidase N
MDMDSIQYKLQSTSKSTVLYYAGLVIISVGLIITTIMGAIHVHSTYKSTPLCVGEGPSQYQLPRTVVPTSYKLHLKPNMKTFNYDGAIDITLEVKSRTKCIVLNAEDLVFTQKNVTLTDSSNKQVKLVDFNFDNDATKLYLSFERVLDTNEKLHLKINYSGKLRDDLQGFYKSSYTTKDGVTKVIATTQFESESARTAFPCFDEPSFKATFTISIELQPEDAKNENLKVLSNMPEELRTPLPDGSVTVLFQESPPMSTYLVAYIIGEFDYVEAVSEGITFRVYSLPGDGPKGQFQLGVAQGVTKFLNEFFDVKYALPKMDLIGIPDFRAGAMENWGLITFRSTYLLVDNQTTQSFMEGGAEVVAHEIAHQWTGNLITTNWWNHIWLNEGFATFFETLSLDAVHPEWNRWEAKLTNSIQPALAQDALKSTHPIVNSALSPEEVEAVFDTITYDKGGSFLLMAYQYLGKDTFKAWMRQYFKTYQWKNAETPQLFEVLEQTSQKAGIAKKFATWTDNAGFPLITVKKEGNKYSLSQTRFLSQKPSTNETDAGPIWWVPVTASYKGSSNVRNIELNEKTLSNALDVPSNGWLKLNVDQHGFYRVNYPSENWLALFDDIENLKVGDKFGIIDDVFALTFSGDLNMKLTLKLLPYLKDENTFIIWDAVFTHLGRINGLIAKEPIHASYQRMIIDLIKEKYDSLGWNKKEADTNDDIKLRTLILAVATGYELEDAVEKADELFWNAVESGSNTIEPDNRQTVYKTVVAHGGEAAYNEVLRRFLDNSTDFQEASRLMYALAWARDPALLKNTLELTLSPSIRSQDAVYVIREVARNPYGQDLAWEFSREYYSLIVKRAGQRTVSARLITGVTNRFTTKTKYEEVKAFFTERDNTQYLTDSLETILTNEQFLRSSYSDLQEYLQENFAYENKD